MRKFVQAIHTYWRNALFAKLEPFSTLRKNLLPLLPGSNKSHMSLATAENKVKRHHWVSCQQHVVLHKRNI